MNHKIIIYQTLPRLFGNKTKKTGFNGTLAENDCGKFDDFTHVALKQIKQLGATHIWYTGILEHGTTTDYSEYGIKKDHPTLIKGRAGSPYAIKDYYDVDPDLAVDPHKRMQEFEALIKRTHETNLKVIIDFVPNHLYREYFSDVKPEGVEDFGKNDNPEKSFDPQNNFYYLPGTEFHLPDGIAWLQNIENEIPPEPYREVPVKTTGNDRFTAHPDKYDWYETIKLNYGVDVLNGRKTYFDPMPDTWHKMLDILLYWAAKGVDGFRCDMAEMVPVEFWQWAIGEVKNKFPEIIFIAEIYNPSAYTDYIQRGGFDYLYDKMGVYDTLFNIIHHGASARTLTGCWQALEGKEKQMLRFIENHDEVRIASAAYAGNPRAGIPAMTVTAAMNTGPVMLYGGQEMGERAAGAAGYSGDDGRTTIYDYAAMPQHQQWMNDGKFDGGLLEDDQKSLRKFYQKLLTFCRDSEAIAAGKFYDLMWANENAPRGIYAWLRYTENEKLLLVVNFENKKIETFVKIPEHAFGEMGWSDKKEMRLTDILQPDTMGLQKQEISERGIPLVLEGYGARIITLAGF
ncbi:MAG TPA: alpha-amylase family protein [Bacteroidales bacterium]|nr:alpha-amylase family protein [Bacteroidales bacterium]